MKSSRARASLTALVALLLAVPAATARAQTRACPPCGPNDRCVDGVCLPISEAPPAVALPPPAVEAPPPAPPAVEIPPPAVEAPPPPPARPAPTPRRDRATPAPKPRRPAGEEQDEDETPSWRQGLLFIPSIGIHAVEGIAAGDYDAGLRLGALLGTRVTSTVSLNLELASDFLSPVRNINSNVSGSGRDFTIAFSPLFHGASRLGELVAGPKLGYWTSGLTQANAGAADSAVSQGGWAFGFNLGGFINVTDDIGLGGLVAYQMVAHSESCVRPPATALSCSTTASVPQLLSFSLAAEF